VTPARIAAAAVLAAAAYAGSPAAPATAAGCSTDHGVTVVVDFHELGGGVQTACIADGGGETAAQLFPAAGFPLTYVQRQPGFVCQVSGKPADSPCVNTPPADAYWGLFWSDGTSGSWTYATSGAGGQHVPDGGYVGFSWQGSDIRAAPGYRPAPHPSPSPTPTPDHDPTHAPTHDPTQPGSSMPPTTEATSDSPTASTSTSAAASPSSTGRGTRHGQRAEDEQPSPTPTATGSGSASASPSLAPASSDPADPGDGGLPGWVAPAVVAVLFGAAGAVAMVRRQRSAP